MQSQRVWDLLQRIKQQEQNPNLPRARATHTGGIEVPRARALALDSSLWTAQEREHIQTCSRCRQLVVSFAQALPQVSWWELAAHAQGQLSGPRARMVKLLCVDHLAYRRRLQYFEGLRERVASLVRTITIPTPTAASGTFEAVDLQSRDRTLRATLFEDRSGRLVVEVRSRELALDGRLVGCVFRTAGGQRVLVRYLVLGRPEHGGVLTGHLTLDRATAQRELGGRIESVEVMPLDGSLLTSEDTSALTASVDSIRDDRQQRLHWRHWLEQVLTGRSDLDPSLRQSLEALKASLPAGSE